MGHSAQGVYFQGRAGQQRRRSGKFSLPWVGVAALLTLGSTAYAVLAGISYRQVLVCSVALLAMATVAGGERGWKFGFLGWICTFGLGYRTIELTPYLRLHPSELVLWGLLALVVAAPRRRRGDRTELQIPLWLWLFLPFWALGWIRGLQAGRPWDLMFSEFKDFLILIPLFLVAGNVLKGKRVWRLSATAFFATGAWIGGMGLVEYCLPGIRNLFPGFVTNPIPTLSADGFARATFSFWGGAPGTFVCVLAAPMVVVAWRWWRRPWQRSLVLSGLLLQIAGTFIGGYRSMWLLLGGQFVLWALLSRGPVLGILILLPTLAGQHFVGGATRQRAESLVLTLEGRPIDSSAATRWERATDAWQAAMEEPWGAGWAGAGWVHSDFLQVAANLGIVAGLVFACAYLSTFVRLCQVLWRLSQKGWIPDLGLALLLSFLAAGGILAMQGVEVLPQLAFPVWFVWAFSEVWLRRVSHFAKKRRVYAPPAHFCPVADLQLRSHRARHFGVGQMG